MSTAAVRRARKRLDRLEQQRVAALEVLHYAIREAREAGVSVIELADAADVSRVTVYSILEAEPSLR